jgi:DNA-binding transcriptional ArsR family regulator/predicted O-methyltransferase YrrM
MAVVPSVAPRIELYKLVAEPARLRVLAACAEEELTVGELAEALGEGQPNVSRHASALRQAGLLAARRDGTRTLLSLDPKAPRDAVVADALASGRALCQSDGTSRRIAALVEARDRSSSAYFSQPRPSAIGAPSPDLSLAMHLVSALVPRRALALDAGTGDGALAASLAQAFERVVAVDRSEAQLTAARERMRRLALANVELIAGDVAGEAVRKAVGAGADVVFACRILHHAAKPERFLESLRPLVAPRGRLVVLDYAQHEDEAMREQGDVWLGFDEATLARDLRRAGFSPLRAVKLPRAARPEGPDAHLTWTITVARPSDRSARAAG